MFSVALEDIRIILIFLFFQSEMGTVLRNSKS